MKTRSLILATILAIPSTLAITIESAFAQIQRPIGRAYFLPASPSASPAFVEDSNGDSIIDLSITTSPLPRFEFSILTELDGEQIIDQDNRSDFGFFPNAISPFAYIVDTDFFSERLRDDQGNLLPSTQEEEIIEQIIPGTPEVSFEGNLFTEKLTLDINDVELDLGIVYEFFSEEDFISFLLPFDATIDSFLATNSLDYIVEQNIFGQQAFIDNLILLESSFSINTDPNAPFRGNQPKSSIIFASQSVPEPGNKISPLALGLISIRLLTKYKVRKS